MFLGAKRALLGRRVLFGEGTAGGDLLGTATSGMGIAFSNDNAVVRGHTTNFNGSPTDLLTYTAPSPKWVYNSAGLLWQSVPATDGLPLDYHPTTFESLGVLVEEARTNLCLYSDDFTNAAWVKTNLSAAKTATGPDGVVNSASTLTATAANATALQAITSASAARITSMFVKRRTGAGVVEMTQDNGTTWTSVTVAAGWTRVQIPSATAVDPTVGVRVVTSGDAVDVALFDHELGAFITSPIPTVASQVTRAKDQISLATSAIPLNATAGTMVWHGDRTLGVSTGFSWMWSLDDGTANERILNYNNSPTLFISDGGAVQVDINDGAVASAVVFKTASGWALNDVALSRDGRVVVIDAVVTLPTVTSLKLGMSQSSGGQLNGHIKSLTYFPTRRGNADLVTLSTL